MIKVFSLPYGDLASRTLAVPYRQKLENALAEDRTSIIQVDLQNVQSISESYADEIFGILVKEFGVDIVLDRMKLINADEYVLESIASVIDRRMSNYC